MKHAVERAAELTRERRWSSRTNMRAALIAFVAIEAVGFPLLLWWGHRLWFAIDDWQFLTARTAGNAGDLFRPHFNHWVTLPVLAYRALWTLFGLRYLPYQVLVLSLHLTAAALLRIVMRRANVGPWLSTAAAAVFVLFGAGAENVLVAFQIAFVGSLVFGLSQLLLADHDGPLDGRDWLGLAAGLCGLMCSNVGISMVAVVGLAALCRRGWRIALFHTTPLAAAFVVWYAAVGHEKAPLASKPVTPASVTRFVFNGLQSTLARLGYVEGVGVALFAVLVVGLILTFTHGGLPWEKHDVAAPVALLVGAVVFLAIAGVGRSGINPSATVQRGANALIATGRQSRYLHIVAAMMLPGIALAAQAILQRWRRATVIIAAVLIIGVPGNANQFRRYAEERNASTFTVGTRRAFLAAPRLQLAPALPRSRQPDPVFAPGVTMGWLDDALRDGRLPTVAPLSPVDAATLTLALVLVPSRLRRPRRCALVSHATSYEMRRGQSFAVKGAAVRVSYLPQPGVNSRPLTIPSEAERLVLAGPVRLRFAAIDQLGDGSKAELCV